MTSPDGIVGRTWYSAASDENVPCSYYMGLRVPMDVMRSNASTMWEVSASSKGQSFRTMMRMFLRINFSMMKAGDKFGEGARAYMEWDSETEMDKPTHFCMHVLYNPPEREKPLDFSKVASEDLGRLCENDMTTYRKWKTMPHVRWKLSDLVLRADMWAALCSIYAPDAAALSADTDNFMMCSPPHVFSADNAGVGDRWAEEDGAFILRGCHVQMTRSDMDPEIFFNKFCPWYQTAQLPDYPLHTTDPAREAMLLRMARAIPDGSIDEVRSVWEMVLDRVSVARTRFEGERYRAWAEKEVAHGMDGEQAGYVPAGEKALNEYEMAAFEVLPCIDATLSPFAHCVAGFLMRAEAYAFVYKQHMLLLKLLMGSMDAMREATSGEIHYSAILAGPNSTSKSYVFTLLERMLVKGTVDRATRRTECSLTYAKDQGFRILVDHELSGDFFGDSSARGQGGSRTAQTKEIMTSHEASVESCQMIDGERVKVDSKSRAHLCYLAATNDWSVGQNAKGETGKDAALVSRFDVVFPTRSKIKNKNITDLMAMERNPSRHDTQGMEALCRWTRNVQKCIYWIFKLIHVRAIPPVNMDAVNAVIDRFGMTTAATPRAMERVLIMTRILCITSALHMHYAMEASPRKGQVPHVSHMKELNLITTAEQAKFALELFADELQDTGERELRIALRNMNLRPDPELGYSYLRVLGCDTASALSDEIMMHIPSGADMTPDSLNALMGKLRVRVIKSKPYKPSMGTAYGTAKDPDRADQNFYAMRGASIHASMVEDDPRFGKSVQDRIDQDCHVGPEGREITARCVPGFAHILQVRHMKHHPKPFVKACMYFPPCAGAMLDNPGLVQQDHRRHSRLVMDVPPEVSAMRKAGLACPRELVSASMGGYSMAYPDGYVKEVNKHDKEWLGTTDGGYVNQDDMESLKRKLPSECFTSNKRSA